MAVSKYIFIYGNAISTSSTYLLNRKTRFPCGYIMPCKSYSIPMQSLIAVPRSEWNSKLFSRRKVTQLNDFEGATHKRGHQVFASLRVWQTDNRKHYFSENISETEKLQSVWCISEMGSNKKQLGVLDSYFGKIEDGNKIISTDSCDDATETIDRAIQFNTDTKLKSLNAYLEKLNSVRARESENLAPSNDTELDVNWKPKVLEELIRKDVEGDFGRSNALEKNDESSHLQLISALATINIAVFLFELASPVNNTKFELYSLPLLYGAKINDLILDGEWWRLVTPMFLHSGFSHVALGCWSLLTFGPQICESYGSFTFLLIYILGGISGNLTSFLHTPEPAVGGTGPVFAIIGAWLIYQIQNKYVVGKEVAESMFQKAIFTTAVSFILSHFGPIDDWTHLGAMITGIAYGFLTCPILQVNSNTSLKPRQDRGVTQVGRYASPFKSMILFTIFLLVLGSLILVIEPPLETMVFEDLEFM